MKLFAFLLAIIGGVSSATQAGVNGELSKKIGVLETSFISFLVGTIALLLMVFLLGKGNLSGVFSSPKWQLTGGLLGAVFVYSLVFATPKVGVASTLVAVISGQLLTSTIIDHFGWMSGKSIPIDWNRGIGIMLMASALFFFFRR